MKRKVNRVGQNTLTVSLPSRWVKEQNVKAGDEVEVAEDKGQLVVSTSPHLPEREITITIPSREDFLKRFIYSPYIKGYDTIILKYGDKAVYHKIVFAMQRIMGFEIIDHTDNSCTIANISTKLEQNFDVLLRRLFLNHTTFAKELLHRLQNPNSGDLNELLAYEDTANRIALFCKRALQKHGVKKSVYSVSSLYTIVSHIEMSSDALRWYIEQAGKKEVKLSKKTIELFEAAIKLLEIAFTLFQKLNSGDDIIKHLGLFKQHKALRMQLENQADYFDGDKLNNYLCAQLFRTIELSHHITEELFY